MTLNKSFLTNILAFLLTILGYFSPFYPEILFSMGIFALSGSITNLLAIHMLFEKIPFLYGSGVVINRFEDFKKGIKNLIIEEFFDKKHIANFFKQNGDENLGDKIINKVDFDQVFADLVEAISNSPLGSMLSMFGGKEALDPIKEPITIKLKEIILELSNKNLQPGDDIETGLIKKIEKIIDDRLKDLTPKIVKNIIAKMIRQHLGWLVVWGGVFGGLIGLVFSLLNN